MRRPLFWMGFAFLSSAAAFLRFKTVTAVILCLTIAFLSLLFSNAKFKTGLLLFTACATFGALFCLAYNAGIRYYLSPVLAAKEQPVQIVMTVTEKETWGHYNQWQGISKISLDGSFRTFFVTLSGYTQTEIAVGEVLNCTAKLVPPFSGNTLKYQSVKQLPAPERSPHPLTQLRLVWQQALSKRAAALSHNAQISGIFSAILTGDRTRLPNDVTAAFRGSGLSHILVVSGLHLILVSRLVGLLLSRICPNRRIQSLLLVLFCWLFAAISGFGSSVVRAAVMLTLVHLAEAANRQSDTLTSLMIAALLMGIVNPYILISISFLLSFGAVAGLATLEKPILNLFENKIPHSAITTHLLQSLSVGIAAQVGAAPVLIWSFGVVPLLGIIANLIAVWLIEPVMLLGILALSLSFLFPALASIAAFVCSAMLQALLIVAQFFAQLPFSQLSFTEHWQMMWLLGSLLLMILILSKRPRAPIGRFSLLLCLAAGLTASVIFTAINSTKAQIILFKNSNSAAVVCGSHATLFGAPQNSYTRYEIQNAFNRVGVKALDAIVIDSASQATYHTAVLAEDYPDVVLCCPASRSAVTFSHAAGLELRHLPNDTLLYGGILYRKSGDETTLFFSEAQLLKSAVNCVIIGKYAEPRPFSDTVVRARTKLT